MKYRTLQPGERVPDGTPRRHVNGRYVDLLWIESRGVYARVKEHRIFEGFVLPADIEVHHRDHDGHNNDPSNLAFLSRAEHHALHRRHDHDLILDLFRQGLMQTEIARRVGASTAQVSRALTGAGIPRRPKGPNGVKRRNFSTLQVYRKVKS